jgi:hypothetical protein
MKELRLIVAVGRDFDDADHLSRVLFAMADVEFADRELRIVCSTNNGTGKLAGQFADANGVVCYWFSSSNVLDMCHFSDSLLAVWDGVSKEVGQTISCMQYLNKPVTIIRY